MLEMGCGLLSFIAVAYHRQVRDVFVSRFEVPFAKKKFNAGLEFF